MRTRAVHEEHTGTEASNLTPLTALTWAHLLNDGYVNYLPAVLPALLPQLSIPLALVGSLVLAIQGVGSLLQPVTGWWADRIGGRTFVLVGLSLSSLGASLIGLAPDYWFLIAMLLVAGLGNAVFHPQALASARSLSRTRQGLSMSFFLVGGEIGRGAWPSVASLIVVFLGLHSLWLFALPGLVTLALLSRVTPSLPAQLPDQFAEVDPGRWGAVAAMVSYVGIRGTLTYGVATFVPLLWQARGGSLVGGASLISVMLLVGIVGNLLGGVLADWIGRRPVLLASSMFSALFLALFLVSGGAWLWVTLGMLGVATFVTAPITMLIGQDLFPRNRSMGSGFALGMGNALGAVAIFALGFVAAQYGVAVPLWWIAGVSLLGIPLALALPDRPGGWAGG